MSLDISDVRAGIAVRLSTITGLRVSSYMPDSINVPQAVVTPETSNYEQNMGRTIDSMTFVVQLFVSRSSERAGQLALDEYVQSTGTRSIKAAIQGDKTLGGAAADCRVTQMRAYGTFDYSGTQYLGAEFELLVMG